MAMTTIKIVLSGDDYQAGIQMLRDELRDAKRKEGTYLRLDLFDAKEAAAPIASLLMETVTLYIDAFLGAAGQWYYFSDVAKKPGAAQTGINEGKMLKINLKGTHSALGTNDEKMKYKRKDMLLALPKLAAYTGKKYDDLKLPLSFAVVACAEAARFVKAETAIHDMLASYDAYFPLADWDAYYKNWQALCKGDGTAGSAIKVRYMAPAG